MTFALSKLAWLIIAPGNLILILLILGMIFLALGWHRAGWSLATLATLALAGIALTPIGPWLVVRLEQRFQPPDPIPETVDGIIVLGGSIIPGLSAAVGSPQMNDSAERITELVILARRYPQARLVFTSGSGNLWNQTDKEADYVRLLLAQLGMDTDRILFERESRNTWENAIFSKELVKPAPGETWLLVTSARHMPRSVGIFRKVGWPVVPWPVDYSGGPGAARAIPYSLLIGLRLTNDAAREYVGLASNYWMGRTDALFPAPEGEPRPRVSPSDRRDTSFD